MAIFVITDGKNNYIKRDVSGKFISVNGRLLADEFNELWKAKKILNNNVNPKHRKRFHIADGEEYYNKKNIDNIEIKLSTENAVRKIDELKEKIIKLQKFISDNDSRRIELNDLLSNIDKEITDIQHYIELNDIENEKCLNVYMMLKDRLRKRRDIKNELNILRQLVDCKMENQTFNDLLSIISDIDNRKYVPRVLKNLFD